LFTSIFAVLLHFPDSIKFISALNATDIFDVFRVTASRDLVTFPTTTTSLGGGNVVQLVENNYI